MNTKRLILAIVVGFIFIFATDFLIHAVWLMPDYNATKSLWRPEAEMNTRFPWMLGAQLLCAMTFVLIWASGFAVRGSVGLACAYGLLMGLFVQVTTIITFVVSPFPPELAFKWFLSGVAQSILLGVVTFFAYKPSPETARS
jgi:magnesium-transporting ATPase (P-type)